MPPSASGTTFPASIARGLTLGLAAMLLALLLGLSVSLVFTSRVIDGYRAVSVENQRFQLLDEIEAVFHRMLLQLMRAGRTPDGAAPAEVDVQALRDEFAAALARFAALHPAGEDSLGPAGRGAFRTLQVLRAELDAVAGEVLGARRALRWEQVERLNQIAIASHQAAASLEAEHRGRIAARVQAGRRSMWIMTGMSAAGFLGGALLVAVGSLLLRRRLVLPLRGVARAALQLAGGRLEARVPVISRDEVGEVSRAFNTMADRLQARERELCATQAELEQRVRVTQALHQIGVQVAGLDKLEPILQLITEKARELLQADVATICLRGDRGGERILRAVAGPPEALQAPCGSPECSRGAGAAACGCCALESAFLAAHLKAPLTRDGSPIGFLCLGRRTPGEPTPAETDLLAALATQASIAFEKAAMQDELRSLGAVQERERIAREMHDGLAQMVGLLHLKLQQVGARVHRGSLRRGLGEAIRLAEQAYDEVRQAISGLRLKLAGGVVPTLRECLQDFSLQTGIVADLTVGTEAIVLPPLAEAQLVRIAQEALTNVRKHARATHVWLRLERANGDIRLAIEDDGCGFDPAAVDAFGDGHFGLQSMRERAEGLGGRLTVSRLPRRGMQVAAVLPAGR